MDTYPAESPSAFDPRNDGARIWGRGSADAKGSLAAMLAAVVSASRSPRRRAAVFVASVDEEHGLSGARTLAESRLRADLAITGEPTSLVPVTSQKGVVRFRVILQGPDYHAAYPLTQGCLDGVRAALDATRGFQRTWNGRNPETTVTPISILSNGAMNCPATHAEMWFDARLGEATPDEAEFLPALTGHFSASMPEGIRVEVEQASFISPPNNCDTELGLVPELLAIVRDVVGSSSPRTSSYGSEAGYLAKIASTSLVLGPGDERLAHHADECIKISELRQAEQIFTRLLVP